MKKKPHATVCEICGNSRDEGETCCPYCGGEYPAGDPAPGLEKLQSRQGNIFSSALSSRLQRKLFLGQFPSTGRGAVVCDVCGNERSGHDVLCPYCGGRYPEARTALEESAPSENLMSERDLGDRTRLMRSLVFHSPALHDEETGMLSVCELCGNERQVGKEYCPFCGAKYPSVSTGAVPDCVFATVNLERGMPTVEEALKRMEMELERARANGIQIITLIHGYGSSGRGGKIRQEVRKLLHYYHESGQIRKMIKGEDFTKKDGQTRDLLRRFPHFTGEDSLGKGNKGVSLIEL